VSEKGKDLVDETRRRRGKKKKTRRADLSCFIFVCLQPRTLVLLQPQQLFWRSSLSNPNVLKVVSGSSLGALTKAYRVRSLVLLSSLFSLPSGV